MRDPVDAEDGKILYMGDRWYNPDNGKDLSDSRYVWLPIEFGANNTIAIKNYKTGRWMNWMIKVRSLSIQRFRRPLKI